MIRLSDRFERTAILCVAMAVAACAPGAANLADEAAMVEVRPDEAARRVDVLVDGAVFTAYIYPESLKKPILHPLRTASGRDVTRGYPLEPRPGERVDHPHQVGLWFNYGDVNGFDLWNNSDAIPEDRVPTMGTVVHRTVRRAESGPGRGLLEVTTDWVDAEGSPLLREDTRFVFHAEGEARALDRVTTLTALDQRVRLDDNKEGLLVLRVARALEQPSSGPVMLIDAWGRPSGVREVNNEGVTGWYRSSEGLEGDDVWGTRARWAMLSGVIEGEPVTVAILDHPDNVGHPTYWHARGYGLFAANPLGQKEFSEGAVVLNHALEPGEAMTFRHRVLVLTGEIAPDEIEARYRAFLAED